MKVKHLGQLVLLKVTGPGPLLQLRPLSHIVSMFTYIIVKPPLTESPPGALGVF